MKNLDLNGLGVQEMNAEEMRETEGGLILELICIGLLITFGILGMKNPDRVEVTYS